MNQAYAGDLSPKDAWELLSSDAQAVLVDVRTPAEWTYVGIPDLSGIGKKPVLVTDGTWMSDQLQHQGAGVVCRDGDSASITDGLLLLQQRYPELARRAEEKRAAWLGTHNPLNFVETLLRVAGAPA